MHDHPEYQKLQRQFKIARFTVIPLLFLAIIFFGAAVGLIDTMPHLLLIAIPVLMAAAAVSYIVLKKLAKKDAVLREQIHGKPPTLTATHPLFQAIIDEYERIGLEDFTESIRLPGWTLEECDDSNGFITIIFTRNDAEIVIDLSDSEITFHFNEEAEDVIITEPLTEEAFADADALCRHIRSRCSAYYTV